MRIRRAIVASYLCGASLIAPALAGAADPMRWHLEAGGAHALGDPQGSEYGFGAQGALAAELPLTRALGLQLELGGLWLPETSQPANPSIARHSDGTALTGMGGLRIRPFTVVAGPWADLHLGYVRTGALDRFGIDAHAGYDWRVGDGRWDVGPYVGYLEIVQPGGDARPQDAHVLSVGIHVALGVERPREEQAAAPPPEPPTPSPPPEPSALPPDCDSDGIPDGEDACPDVPGVHTDDPKTNGCPAAGDQVRVVEDHIEYDDVILFDTNSPHVHHASWPILQKLAVFINAHPDIQELDITGHTDERGTEAHNLQLSKFRAEVVKYLLVHFGVDAQRITTQSYGYAHPRAQGHTEADWRQNRRVEFIITKVRNVQGGTTTLPPGGPQ